MQIELSYLADNPIYKEEKPYTLFLPSLEKDTKTTNCEYVVHDGIPVENARGREAEFTLDSCGFAFLQHKSQQHCSCKDFESIENGESVVMPYLRECVQVLKGYLNPTRVLCFDWRVRKRPSGPIAAAAENLEDSRFKALDTASVVHLDYSLDGGKSRMKRQLSVDELNEYTLDKYRIRIINIWRPLVDTVYDTPLVLCDKSTVKREELIGEDKVHEDYLEEGQYLKYSPEQKWYWLSEQSRHEVTIFVTWDSDEEEDCACAPHAAFQNPNAPGDAPPRESVEVRLMVFEKR